MKQGEDQSLTDAAHPDWGTSPRAAAPQPMQRTATTLATSMDGYRGDDEANAAPEAASSRQGEAVLEYQSAERRHR